MTSCAPTKKDWWEEKDEGYNTDSKVNTEFLWEDETKRTIKERLGVVDEDTDDDSGIEGEEEDNYEEDGEKRVDKSKENNDDEDNEDNEGDEDYDDDDDKGHQNCRSNRKKGRLSSKSETISGIMINNIVHLYKK